MYDTTATIRSWDQNTGNYQEASAFRQAEVVETFALFLWLQPPRAGTKPFLSTLFLIFLVAVLTGDYNNDVFCKG